jgi:hypothetical protein
MALTPEGRVKAAVKKRLKELGVWWYCPVSNGMGRVGAPDFICCHGGRFVAIETKAPGKRGSTTPNQDKEIMGIHRAGGVAVVIDDVNQLEQVFTCQHHT